MPTPVPTASAWPEGPVSTGISVLEVREVAPRQAMFYIDGDESSFVDLDDPAHLEFEYMQHVDAALAASRGNGPVRALHLGGGACCLARAWDATRPGSAQLAVEWDPGIARAAREWFPLPRSPRLRIRTGDAREALESFPDGRWDVIVRDVFVRGDVPEHLADLGAWREMLRVLAPDGLIATNVVDRAPLRQARADVAAALEVVGHAVAIGDPAVLKGRRYGNIVVAAAPGGLDETELAGRLHGMSMPARMLSGADLAAFVRR